MRPDEFSVGDTLQVTDAGTRARCLTHVLAPDQTQEHEKSSDVCPPIENCG